MATTRMMSNTIRNLVRNGKLQDNTDEHVFTININEHNAEVQYLKQGDVYDLIHTSIPDQYQGQGLGNILAEVAIKYNFWNTFQY